MKKLLLALLALFFTVSLAYAGGSSPTCNTKGVIILAHGMGFSDGILGIHYWYGIPTELKNEGAQVYVTAVNCMDSTVNKATSFKKQVLQILAVTGKSKVNILAHSHGGLYSRYAITNLGLSSKVSSLTTLCTPHRGSAVADVIIGVSGDVGGWLIGSTLDWVYGFLLGDKSPQSYKNAIDVSRPYCNNIFNPNTPNVSGVYYQSWATKIFTVTADLVLEPSWLLLNFHEGANDGLVSVTSAKWGTFKGTYTGSWYNVGGVSHINAINHFFGITPGADIPAWYVSIVSELKGKGY